MKEKISFTIIDDFIIRRVYVKGRGVKTSKLRIPLWVDRAQSYENIYDLSWLGATEPPRVRASAYEIRAVDLFCGCGGLTLGIREAARALGCSFCSVFASDINKKVLSIYSKNFRPNILDSNPIERIIDGDLGSERTKNEKDFCNNVGKIDVLVAGPPCQGHSNLNNHTRRDDPRNLLYLRTVRCAEILKPNTLIIENVPGVLYDKHGVLQTADEYLKRIGYSVSYGVVKMCEIGVAQTRKRMFLVASRAINKISLSEIVQQFAVPVRDIMWVIGDLLDCYDNLSIFDSSAVHSTNNQNRIHFLFENNLYNLPSELQPDCHRFKLNTYPSVYGRMYPNKPSPTLTGGFSCCGRGRFVHPLLERTLTPHEAARIQFFPDFFSFDGLARTELCKAIGNAVPARAGYVIALPLLLADQENQSLI